MKFYEDNEPKPLRLLSDSRIKWYLKMFEGRPPTEEFKKELESRRVSKSNRRESSGENSSDS